MKTFTEYLAESTKTYDVRIKIAEYGIEANELKKLLDKYQIVSFKKTTTTPVQEHPHEFPRLKNKEVSIYDATVAYPVSFAQLEQSLSEILSIPQDHIKVKHPADPTEETVEPNYDSKLMDTEYKDDTAINKPLYGDAYNMSLMKELMNARKDSDRSDVQGDGKTVDMGEEDKSTPVPNSK